MTPSPLELVERVTRWTLAHPDERDPWEKAPAMTGVLAWNNADAVAGVRRWIDRAVDTQGSDGYLCYSERIELPHGHVRTFTPTGTLSAAIGYPMLEVYERTKDARYLEAARLQAEAILRAPRTRDGGISCRFESKELWVDFIYLMGPFLARYGRIAGERKHIDEAFAQYEVHGRHLIDPFTNLTRHAWCETPNHFPQSTLWARGNGWLSARPSICSRSRPTTSARSTSPTRVAPRCWRCSRCRTGAASFATSSMIRSPSSRRRRR